VHSAVGCVGVWNSFVIKESDVTEEIIVIHQHFGGHVSEQFSAFVESIDFETLQQGVQ
jgi:hypothetical protein